MRLYILLVSLRYKDRVETRANLIDFQFCQQHAVTEYKSANFLYTTMGYVKN